MVVSVGGKFLRMRVCRVAGGEPSCGVGRRGTVKHVTKEWVDARVSEYDCLLVLFGLFFKTLLRDLNEIWSICWHGVHLYTWRLLCDVVTSLQVCEGLKWSICLYEPTLYDLVCALLNTAGARGTSQTSDFKKAL